MDQEKTRRMSPSKRCLCCGFWSRVRHIAETPPSSMVSVREVDSEHFGSVVLCQDVIII